MTPITKWAFLARLLLVGWLPLLGGCNQELVCTADQAICGGACASLASDPAHCGACGRACGSGESCQAGLCCSGSQCPPALYATCSNTATVQGATTDLQAVGAPVRVEETPISMAWVGRSLWVANSRSNTLDELTIGPPGATKVAQVSIPVAGQFVDLEYVAAHEGLLYVSNAAASSIVVVDPAHPANLREIPLPTYASPQGIAFSGNKGYVALNGLDEVAVVDLTTLQVTSTIALSGLVQPGALAMPARLVLTGSRLYVTLWNLKPVPPPVYIEPAGNGLLAVIDIASDPPAALPFPIDLGEGCLDPAGMALLDRTLYVTCGFLAVATGTVTGAAIVPVNVSAATPSVGAHVSVPAGASPGAITFCGDVAYIGDNASGSVLRFDPAQRSVAARGVLCPPNPGSSSYVADVACGR